MIMYHSCYSYQKHMVSMMALMHDVDAEHDYVSFLLLISEAYGQHDGINA